MNNESDPKRNVVPVERRTVPITKPTAAMIARLQRQVDTGMMPPEALGGLSDTLAESAGVVGGAAVGEAVSIEPGTINGGSKDDVAGVTEAVNNPSEFDDLVNGTAPSYEFQQGNDLPAEVTDRISQEVQKNIDLTRLHGSEYFNQPRE